MLHTIVIIVTIVAIVIVVSSLFTIKNKNEIEKSDEKIVPSEGVVVLKVSPRVFIHEHSTNQCR